MQLIEGNFDPVKSYKHARNAGEIDLSTATLPFPTSRSPNAADLEAVTKIVDQVKRSRPMAFILEGNENIKDHQFGDYLGSIMTDLQCSAGYEITNRVLGSAAHGVPHCRRRMYVCGIRNDCNKERMVWPEAINPCSVETCLMNHREHPAHPELL